MARIVPAVLFTEGSANLVARKIGGRDCPAPGFVIRDFFPARLSFSRSAKCEAAETRLLLANGFGINGHSRTALVSGF